MTATKPPTIREIATGVVQDSRYGGFCRVDEAHLLGTPVAVGFEALVDKIEAALIAERRAALRSRPHREVLPRKRKRVTK